MARKKKSKADPKETQLKAKNQALELTLEQISKAHGAGAIMRLGQDATLNVPAISTGSLSSIWRSASAGSPAAGSPRSTAPSRRARRPWP